MLSSAWMRYCLILWTLDVHLCSRSPQGERGLKSWGRSGLPAIGRSLPARGAWIEIVIYVDVADLRYVAPRKGSVD